MIKIIIKLVVFTYSLFFVSCSNSGNTENVVDGVKYKIDDKLCTISLAKLIDSLQVKQHNISIHIDKSDYTLSVMNKDTVLKSYSVVLGTNPIGDKRMEGDRCTPEGTFHIISKYPHKDWRKFLWIDYPNEESRRKFKEAKVNGEIPKDAKIGGEVGIHGTPEDCDYLIDEQINWTWGCISLKRKDVDEIYPYVKEETDIVIER